MWTEKNCICRRYFTSSVRGIGISFQLAIIASRINLIDYDIASAQRYRNIVVIAYIKVCQTIQNMLFCYCSYIHPPKMYLNIWDIPTLTVYFLDNYIISLAVIYHCSIQNKPENRYNAADFKVEFLCVNINYLKLNWPIRVTVLRGNMEE